MARQDILDCYARYCQYYALTDRSFVDLFTEDCTYGFAGSTTIDGREALHRSRTERPPLAGTHVTVNPIVEVDGDEAHAVTDFLFITPENLEIAAMGRYTTDFVRRDGRWLFHRHVMDIQSRRPV